MITIDINKENNELTISSTKKFDDFSVLMDELGELDIVQANEIEQDYIAHSGDVYSLTDLDINILNNTGSVSLSFIGTVLDIADEDFINWYF